MGRGVEDQRRHQGHRERGEMRTRRMRLGMALVAPVAIALLVAWFDGRVLLADQQRAVDYAEMDPLALSMPAGYLLAMAGVLAMAFLSRWEPSALVGIAYAVGGVVLAFALPLTVITPKEWSARGPAHLVSVVGAGMLLVGLGALVTAARRRAESEQRQPQRVEGDALSVR